jgi:transposase
LKWAAGIGPHTVTVVEHQLVSRPHPEHGYRACLGLLNLVKTYSPQRLEAACQRAQRINAMTYKSINSILKKSLDKVPLESGDADNQMALSLDHDNIRGADYYH